MSNTQKILSAFGESAISLDHDFGMLEQLSGQLERLEIETDSGLERARVLLSRFSETGLKIGDGIQALAKNLDEARARAEKAAELVSTRAMEVQKRQNEAEQLLARFQQLGEMVKKITAAVSQLKKPEGGKLSDDEKSLLLKYLPELNAQLDILLGETRRLKDDAQAAKHKALEKNADSLNQSLQAVRNRLNLVSNDRPAVRLVDATQDSQLH